MKYKLYHLPDDCLDERGVEADGDKILLLLGVSPFLPPALGGGGSAEEPPPSRAKRLRRIYRKEI